MNKNTVRTLIGAGFILIGIIAGLSFQYIKKDISQTDTISIQGSTSERTDFSDRNSGWDKNKDSIKKDNTDESPVLGSEVEVVPKSESEHNISDTDTTVVKIDPPLPSMMCNKSVNKSSVEKPKGVFTSVITGKAILNETMQGGLIRATWAQVEPEPGVYDFSVIEEKLALLPEGKKWSLAVTGGFASVDLDDPDLYDGSKVSRDGTVKPSISLNMSPGWLVSEYGVDTFEMEFRNVTVNTPKYWDDQVQERIKSLFEALSKKYKNDKNLHLVYVPQMTSNGIEGHFNGVPESTLLAAAGGVSKDEFAKIWVGASLDTSRIVAEAFDNKAIAFEVHEIMGEAAIPKTIMDSFLTDPSFENRVGIGMWWISGLDTYQNELLGIIKSYTGDVYGQVIGNSSQPDRFPNGDYAGVFTQAKDLCMRYIEPWNYEFDNNTHNEEMKDFNEYADAYFN